VANGPNIFQMLRVDLFILDESQRQRVPYEMEECRWSVHLPYFDLEPVWGKLLKSICCMANGYLSSRREPLPSDRYQIILHVLLGDRHVCVCVYVCKQLAQGRYLTVEQPGFEPVTCK